MASGSRPKFLLFPPLVLDEIQTQHLFVNSIGTVRPPDITLPYHQIIFVNIFFAFAWGFGIEKGRGFLVIFGGLRSWEIKHDKSSKNSEENSEKNSGENSGRKFE